MRNLSKMCTALSLCGMLSACGGSPDQLASKLNAALKTSDADAALALLDSQNIPSQQKFFYVLMVTVDCSEDMTCTATVAPLDDAFAKDLAGQASDGVELATKPEGLIKIDMQGKDAKSKGSARLPYGKVNGSYKILTAHFTPQKLAELNAQTAQMKTDEYLKRGVGDPPNTEWKAQAAALPADGGDAGAALVALIKARTEAIKAGDVDKRIAVGSRFDAYLYGPKTPDGKERSLQTRQLEMRAQSLRELADVKVLGGYQNGDAAVLTIEGHDGGGSTVRGAQLMQKDASGKWQTGTLDIVSMPAA